MPEVLTKGIRRLLIVDDNQLIREGLQNYLLHYHEGEFTLEVDTVATCSAAQAYLKAKPYHLVITDINLSDGDGFAVLKEAREQNAEVKTALITAYKVEDYVRNAQKTGVCNIIAKTAPFDFVELSRVVNNLLNPSSAFGLETYMTPECQMNELLVASSDDISRAIQVLQDFLAQTKDEHANNLLTALVEAVTNAVYHVSHRLDGSLKYQKGQPVQHLESHEQVTIRYAQDKELIGIAISDQGGRMTADEVLYWLERNISGAGVMDTHGRGVYLMHRLADRLLINIAPGIRTEIILLNHLGGNHPLQSNKPIYINQF
jgi:YesN/AraC family two-component response regulator